MCPYPDTRLRRLRRTPGLRRLVDRPCPALSRMLWPVFVVEGENRREAIAALPGQDRLSADQLCRSVAPLAERGLGGLLLFGVVDDACKDPDGTRAWAADGVVQRAVARLKREYPELPVFTDVCLCAYTDHGHCGPLRRSRPGGIAESTVDNDAALPLLARVAVSHAAAGADGVAPSAMMDGQVAAIRRELESDGYTDTVLMSYSTKFASALYGPFREAAASSPHDGDRQGYQASYANLGSALRESALDEQEGADVLMVKPATFYLDVLQRLRARTDLPLAAYNVSGEYAMLHALAASGGGELRSLVRENLTAIQRAGADILITYWANRHDFFDA